MKQEKLVKIVSLNSERQQETVHVGFVDCEEFKNPDNHWVAIYINDMVFTRYKGDIIRIVLLEDGYLFPLEKIAERFETRVREGLRART